MFKRMSMRCVLIFTLYQIKNHAISKAYLAKTSKWFYVSQVCYRKGCDTMVITNGSEIDLSTE